MYTIIKCITIHYINYEQKTKNNIENILKNKKIKTRTFILLLLYNILFYNILLYNILFYNNEENFFVLLYNIYFIFNNNNRLL